MPGSISNETSIANLALTRLGAQRVTDIDTEQTENAAKIRAVFDFLRDETLRGHTWNFATQRVNFNKLTTSPLYGFLNEFQIPGNVLRILPPSTGFSSNLAGEYKIEGDKVLTDDDTFQARCILRIEDTTKWDSTFVEVFATRLQAELAYAIVNNRALANDLTQVYLAKLRAAKAFDAMEDTPDPLQADTWLLERTAGTFAPSTSLGT
jgi:hypothetical protein